MNEVTVIVALGLLALVVISVLILLWRSPAGAFDDFDESERNVLSAANGSSVPGIRWRTSSVRTIARSCNPKAPIACCARSSAIAGKLRFNGRGAHLRRRNA